ncbi:MAG: hypothetical protein M1823_001903 [Watsoniomyces obsoletus]|nr:MAG: hypothetical protein M1823_001903 [Watsoniomyces obsoletus]
MQIVFSDTLILEADAERLLTSSSSLQNPSSDPNDASTEHNKGVTTPSLSHPDTSTPPPPPPEDPSSSSSPPPTTYELLLLKSHPYLCTIPLITPIPKNTTAESLARASEEAELARASIRGKELLSDLHGTCLHFMYGWWSYKFCYDVGVKQFHHLPPQQGVAIWPPQEDENVPSYILGRVPSSSSSSSSSSLLESSSSLEKNSGDRDGHKGVVAHNGGKEDEKDEKDVVKMEVAIKGDQRYLIQHLKAGTICDLTGKERTIEIEYHCHPSNSASVGGGGGGGGDRIAWIKEVTTCSYLMVVYTSKLCADEAFLPPKGSGVMVNCQRVVKSEEERRYIRNGEKEGVEDGLKMTDEHENVEKSKVFIGGVEVGGRHYFAGARGDTKKIDAGSSSSNKPDSSGGDQETKNPLGGSGGGGSEVGKKEEDARRQKGGKTRPEKGNPVGKKDGSSQKKAVAHTKNQNQKADDENILTKKESEISQGDVEKSLEKMRKFQKELEELASKKGWKLEILSQMDGDDHDDDGGGGGNKDEGDRERGNDARTNENSGGKENDKEDEGREEGGSEKGSEEVYILVDGLL